MGQGDQVKITRANISQGTDDTRLAARNAQSTADRKIGLNRQQEQALNGAAGSSGTQAMRQRNMRNADATTRSMQRGSQAADDGFNNISGGVQRAASQHLGD